MKLAMISCAKYSDAWRPFRLLMDRFWPDHPPVTLVSDAPCLNVEGYGQSFFIASNWCEIVREFARSCYDGPLCLFLDDFWLNAPVSTELINRGLEQMEKMNAGCVRLYPCPGPTGDYGDSHFGIVDRGTNYRISTQVALWKPSYLRQIASKFKTPWEFELQGSVYSDSLPEPVLAFKRELNPWPVSYYGAIRHGEGFRRRERKPIHRTSQRRRRRL